MYWPKIETPKLRGNDKLSGPIIIISGIIVSLWSYGIFVTTVLDQPHYDGPTSLLISIALITHILISIASASFLYQGFVEADPNLLKPWLITKGVEITAIIAGIILQFTQYYHPSILIISAGVVFILIGGYSFLCIYSAWKKMKENPQPQPPPTTNLDSVAMEKPPSYDSFANQ